MATTTRAGRAAAPRATVSAIATAAALLLGLAACAGRATAATPLPPALASASTCFHAGQGLVGRALLDLGPESPDALFDLYKGVHWQGAWAFQNTQGQWVVLPPGIGVVPPVARAVQHPRRGLAGAGAATLEVGMSEPGLQGPGMLPGITLFVGYGAAGAQSFEDLLARQRFGVVAQFAGNEPVRANCDTAAPTPGVAIVPAPAPSLPGTGSSPAPVPAPAPAQQGGSFSHGSRYTIQAANLGSKADHNVGNYRYQGQRHLLARFSDFDNAGAATPAANTKAGWQAHLDGIYPILTSTDFNALATASGATVEASGGVTPSGRWLKRRITQGVRDQFPSNYRLRNWNLWDTRGYQAQMYFTGYVNLSSINAPGKYYRFYWTDSSNANNNVWTAKEGGSMTARAEGANTGVPGIYSDAPVRYQSNTWVRYEILADFANDRVSFYADGKPLMDTSRGYTGVNTGWLGVGGKLDYFLLNNTVEMDGEAGEFVGHAMPYLDFSFKRIELADAADWSRRTDAVVQVPTRWANGSVDIVVNQGRFANLEGKHLFLLDGMQATYLGPLK